MFQLSGFYYTLNPGEAAVRTGLSPTVQLYTPIAPWHSHSRGWSLGFGAQGIGYRVWGLGGFIMHPLQKAQTLKGPELIDPLGVCYNVVFL